MNDNRRKKAIKVNELPKKYRIILKSTLILIGIILFLIYGFYGGFESLLYGIKEASSVLGYIIIIFVIGYLLRLVLPVTIQ